MESIQKVKVCGYIRVSTVQNQNPEIQRVAIEQYAAHRGYEIVSMYLDRGVSGVKERRPALDQMLRDAGSGKFKIVITCALDRIARDVRNCLNMIHDLCEQKVVLVSLREQLDLGSPIGRAVIPILASLAQLERDLISDRIRSALAAKKVLAERNGSGWRCGRPTLLTAELRQEILKLRSSGMSIREIRKSLCGKVGLTSIQKVVSGSQRSVRKTSKT